jgi:hypothetical protein
MLTRRNLLTTVGAALAIPWLAAAQKKGPDSRLVDVTLEISGMT